MSIFDNLLATAMMGEGGGGGGGGSSDFSTAQVEFFCSQYYYHVDIPDIANDAVSLHHSDATTEESLLVTVPLYKGKYLLNGGFDLANVDMNVMPTFTGNISLDTDTGYIVIEGNGTITAAGLNP